MASLPTTATIYTNQWVRISGRLRPTNYLLSVGIFALLLGAAVGLANQNMLVALEAFAISLVLGSALSIVLWRRGSATEINLGSEQVRVKRGEVSFSNISGLELHSPSGNLYLLHDSGRVLLPLVWLSSDQLKVIERMMRLLDNPGLSKQEVSAIHEHLLELLRA